MPNIVNVSVSQQVASAPSTLQRTGALISQGATTLAVGATQLLTSVSSLTSILATSEAVSSVSWSTGIVTLTTATPHGIPTSDVVLGVIAGVTVSGSTTNGYNGNFVVTSTGANTLTYAVASNPGAGVTTSAFFTLEDVAELTAMVNTFFAQGSNLGVYVLELGTNTVANGVTQLEAYIAANVGHPTTSATPQFYAYLLPTTWDVTAAQTMAKMYTGTTAQVYFYVSTTLATYTGWTGIKSVFAVLPSPSAPTSEFSTASAFWVALNYNPSASNLASPMEYSFVYAVTPYSALTNTQQTNLLAVGMNWIGTGAQGQISNTLIEGGTFADLNPFNYWYSTDWLAINVQIALAAAIINGSNNPTNPLYYNQAGINALQKVAQATCNNGISFGLILSPCSVNAISFTTYVAQNPSNYAAGIYNGLSVTFVPLRGFTSITIYLTASNIPV